MLSGWQIIYISNQMHSVEIVRAVLKDNNIESILMDKRDSSYTFMGEIEVYVSKEDAILAKIIIEKYVL